MAQFTFTLKSRYWNLPQKFHLFLIFIFFRKEKIKSHLTSGQQQYRYCTLRGSRWVGLFLGQTERVWDGFYSIRIFEKCWKWVFWELYRYWFYVLMCVLVGDWSILLLIGKLVVSGSRDPSSNSAWGSIKKYVYIGLLLSHLFFFFKWPNFP